MLGPITKSRVTVVGVVSRKVQRKHLIDVFWPNARNIFYMGVVFKVN